MAKFLKTSLILIVFLMMALMGGGPQALADQSKVVLVGGGQAYKPLDDFMLDTEVIRTPGDVWYVNKDVSASGDGKSWAYAFETITEGIAALNDDDVLYIAPGFYTEAAELTITESNIRVIGLNTSGKTRGGTSFKTPTAAGPMLTIAVNANDVEIRNISFIATSGQKAIQLGGASTGYVWRTHIHDCAFFGDNTGTYAIANYGMTTTPSAGAFPDVAECVVENNHFYAWSTAAIGVYGTRAMVRNNSIFVSAGDIGIVIGVGRPFIEVSGNKLFGVNSTDTGIAITGTDEDALLLSGNTVENFATPVTLAKYTSWYDGNYWGVDDWKYHQGWGRADAAKRGANGRIFYVDLNMATTGLDGLCWASAFDTVAAGLLAADTWIGTSGNRMWAHRATVYSSHDGESETLTAAAEKTDLVGVGYDVNARPMLTGNFTIGTAVNGFRIFNYSFVGTTTAPVITFPSGMHGWELHDVTIYKSESRINTSGISATTTREWTMKNVRVLPDAGGARNTIGVTLIGDSGVGLMENCYIEGIEALDIANPSMGTIIKDSTLVATALALDDNSDDVMYINMRFITDAAAGDANGTGIVDWAVGNAVGCEGTSSDSAGPMPNLDALS